MNKPLALLRTIYIIMASLFFLSSCVTNNEEKKLNRAEMNHIDSISPLSFINSHDSLKIIVQMSDCGEWGGHNEYLNIYLNSESKLVARLKIDSINCDSLTSHYPESLIGKLQRQIVFDSTKILNINEEQQISIFIQKTLSAYLTSNVTANFGNQYHILTSDESLKLIYWDSGNLNDSVYLKTTNLIFKHLE